MEEEKSKRGLYVGLIIFLVLCLIGTGYFIYRRIQIEPKDEIVNDKNNQKELVLDKILPLIPVKKVNANYTSYQIEDLTDTDINDAICNYVVKNSELVTKNNEKYYLLELSKVADNLLTFLGLKNYNVKVSAGNSDLRYKLEEVTENNTKYLKVKLVEIATDAFDTFELKDLNNTVYDETNNEYKVNVLVIMNMGGGPSLKIGTADIYLKYDNDNITLKRVDFQKYNEYDPIE